MVSQGTEKGMMDLGKQRQSGQLTAAAPCQVIMVASLLPDSVNGEN